MEQLSGLDSAFVHQDSGRTPMHMTAVLVYDAGSSNATGISLEDLQQLVENRLAGFALFRRKLHTVLLGMDNPYWEEIETIAWDHHLREVTLAPGADWPELNALLGGIHGQRLDPAYPLWEFHLVRELRNLRGLPPHCHALVLKVHHAAVDGISMAGIIDALHQPPDLPAAEAQARSPTRRSDVWSRTQRNNFDRQFKLARTVGDLLPGVLRARKARKTFTDLPATHRGKAHFNARVRTGRSTGTVLLAMDDVKAIKHAVRRVTLNDIALACVAGALRDYLSVHRRLPRKSLVSGVPVNLRGRGNTQLGGNQIATMAVGLATDIADPVERLRMIHRYAVAGKKQLEALGSTAAMDVSDSLAPVVLAEGIRSAALASELANFPVPSHTMVTNVPGPSAALSLNGARLVVPFGYGPVRDNMGLFHIVTNGERLMTISFTACQGLMPDPIFYRQCLAEAFSQLLERAYEER